jgi:cobalt-zinc-cadmium efflux system membrane fusion protein
MKIFIKLSIFLSVLSACNSKDNKQKIQEVKSDISIELNAVQLKNAGVKTGVPTLKSIGLLIQANGKIEVPPQNKTIIAAQFGGFIKSVKVLDGMLVKRSNIIHT